MLTGHTLLPKVGGQLQREHFQAKGTFVPFPCSCFEVASVLEAWSRLGCCSPAANSELPLGEWLFPSHLPATSAPVKKVVEKVDE